MLDEIGIKEVRLRDTMLRAVNATDLFSRAQNMATSASSTIQVQQMVVRDEQDIRSLAVEIATLTRRQQRGKGLRMA